MKKFVISFLAIMMLFTMNTVQAEEHWTGTIEMWDFPSWRVDGDNYHWQKRVIERFEEKNPGVEVNLVQIPWSGGPERLDVSVESDNYPDITRGPLQPHYIDRGVVEPLDDHLSLEDREDFDDTALDAYTVDENLYGLPFYSTSMTMVLNLDLFEERGVEPPENGIWTWDEFERKIEELTFENVYGFASSAMPPDNQHLWPFIYSKGARILEGEDNYGFDSEEAIAAVERLQGITSDPNKSLPNASAFGQEDTYAMFREGQVAVMADGAYSIPALVRERPEMNIGTAFYPIDGTDGEVTNVGEVSAYYIFNQEDPEKMEMVFELAKFLTDTNEQEKVHQYGTFPTRKSAQGIYEDRLPEMQSLEEGLEHIIYFPPNIHKERIIEITSRQLQMALLDRAEAEEAMTEARRRIERIFERGQDPIEEDQ